MVVRIKTNKLILDIEMFDKLSYKLDGVCELFNCDMNNHIISEEGGETHDFIYVIGTSSMVSSIEDTLESEGYTVFDKKDVTTSFTNLMLSGDINDLLVQFSIHDDFVDVFYGLVNNFISVYVTKDMILDKIIDHGVDSLNEKELGVLKA